ncbi:hypothetical protein C8R42DRAFT_667502 [Lentinula raphanica]|nr:hypothetical protein C8R42DRAFT_667502 [Lentinula raphanica]
MLASNFLFNFLGLLGMGVAGLWPLLEPAQSVTTLTALSLTKFNSTSRGYRIGIDASIWFFHAEYGKEGENPELRTLFFRCAQLLSQGFLPLFVFDGPLRPDIKRGKRINKSAHKLVTGMQAIIEAFGFEYRTAPGEAEAELAFLNRVGIIDGILSDDVDNFLFGAHTVVRNHSSTHAGAKSAIEKAKVYTYTLPHPAFPDFGREELIFIALCSGGDYGTGLDNCGIKISYGLARAGFGKSLCQAALNHLEESAELKDFVRQWKKHLAHELKTNASGFLPRKSPKLASAIPETFPDIKVLLAYLRPVTSESLGRSERYDDLLVGRGSSDGWLKKDPSLPMLAEKCEFYFEWGFMESIIKRFRTVIFQGVALRIMRRACILQQTTSWRDGKAVDLDTIRSHFASGFHIEDHKSSCPALVKDISKTRKHESTSKTLEYRVAINPTVLVDLITPGVKGIRRPDDKDEWAEFEEADMDSSDNEASTRGKSKQKGYPDPTLPLKLWLPAVVVKEAIPDSVQTYEESQKRKEEKKAGKGKKTKAVGDGPKVKPMKKPKPKPSSSVSAIKEKPSMSQSDIRSDKDLDSSDDDVEYDDLFLPNRPSHSTTTTPNPDDLSSSDVPSPNSHSSRYRLDHTRDQAKSSHKVFGIPERDKGKQKAIAMPRPGGHLSKDDANATPKKIQKDRARQRPRYQSSSPEKMPQPFPVSLNNSSDDDSDDPDYDYESNHFYTQSPAPPGPPQTPSPQKKTRKADTFTSSSESASENELGSPKKGKDGMLNKSPRKSKDHGYPKGLESGTLDQTRRTIRDIPHPSRAARAESPTPLRRTSPHKGEAVHVGAMVESTEAPTPSSHVSNPCPPPPSKDLIFISDSEDEEEERTTTVTKPTSKTRLGPGSKEATASAIPYAIKPTKSSTSNSLKKSTSNTLRQGRNDISAINDDDDVPPLHRARARAKATTKTTITKKPKIKEVVDIIELSDDSS